MKLKSLCGRRCGACSLIGVILLVVNLNGTSRAGDRPVVEFNIVVQEKTIELLGNPKKVATVWAFGLEGQEATVPGPVIRVKKGARVRIHFKNTHVLPHSMHFHGVHPYKMDGNGVRKLGTEQLQMPGESYTYEWTPAEPGYYLYHCHFDTLNHMDHGMYGLFIVEDPAWPAVDQEILTMWDEWDIDGDGRYDTHTINTRSAPDQKPLTAKVGEKVRLVMANVGSDVHTPHMHGVMWEAIDSRDLRTRLLNDANGVMSLAPAQLKVVEFVTPDPGTWLFHCHVLPHVADDGLYERGMLTTLNVIREQS